MMNGIGDSAVLQRRVKRKQALLESNLPGIARSTGVLRRLGSRPVSPLPRNTLGVMTLKTQQVLRNDGRLGCSTMPAYRNRSNNLSICFFSLSIFTGPFHMRERRIFNIQL